MYTKRVFKFTDVLLWTRYETMSFLLLISSFVCVYYFFDIGWFRVPWTAIALIGTAVSFLIGFQNNSVYGRIWEARKIWGGIVNTSRTLGVFTTDMISNEHTSENFSEEYIQEEKKKIIHRHVAWMTALRYAMREDRKWEVSRLHKTNVEWGLTPPEHRTGLKDNLMPYLSNEDLEYVMSKGNKQTAVLYTQSKHLKDLKEKGLIWEFSFLELESVIEELFTLQGKSERIKNFPFPRQYATINHYFMWLLLFLLPLAMVPEFSEIGMDISKENPFWGNIFIWLTIPFYTAVAWMFHTMERIGRTGENPFEGTSNDVPISTISRGIEIDLRQNLGESDEEIPIQFPQEYDIQW